MRSVGFALLPLLACSGTTPPAAAPDTAAAWHDAAAHADEARYFAHFAPEGVFLGTDASERWDVPAFRAYAHPRFAEGRAWTFHSTARQVAFSADGRIAWFDESL